MIYDRDNQLNKRRFEKEADSYIKRSRSRSVSDDRGRKYSISRSRSYSKENKRDDRKRKMRSRSISLSNSYRSISENRSHSPENRGPVQRGPALNFMIFFGKQTENALISSGFLRKIEEQIGDIQFFFDYNYTIPDLVGYVLHIKGEDIKKKRDATQILFDYLIKNNLDDYNEENRKPSDKIGILLLVPNGLVSMIIGTKGRQISNLIKESGANIVVNQPIFKMLHRTVNIKGRPGNVANAILSIQSIMEERYYEVSKVETEVRPLNTTTSHTHVKFVLSEECVDYLNSKKSSFLNNIKDNYDVSISFYQDRKNKQFDRKDYVASLKGTIICVQDAILIMIKKLSHLIRATYDGKDSFSLRMLIHKAYVTKLIGAGGCMIQEIANFSGGASIKILSNKLDERKSSSSDIIVCLAGSLPSIQDAACIIIEQMECFKKGGPVLKSGKSINQNIAQQFINSIFCSAGRKENEDDHCYTLKERFLSKKRSRSRSRSRSHSHHSLSKSEEKIKEKEKRSNRKSKYDENNLKHNDVPYHSENIHKNDNLDYNLKDPSNNLSYEEKGLMKISIDIIVPDYLVSLLIGKKGETIRGIMNKSGSMITFHKEYNDDSKIITGDGVLGRICNIKGTIQQNSVALQLISDMIIKLETSLNGIRKEN